MTAVDPEGRIRHPLDVFHSTLNPDGSFVDAGLLPVADGLGQVEYIDSSTFAGASALDDLTDVVITSPASGQRLRFNGTAWVNTSLIWQPLTNGDTASPEFVFDAGDVIMLEA